MDKSGRQTRIFPTCEPLIMPAVLKNEAMIGTVVSQENTFYSIIHIKKKQKRRSLTTESLISTIWDLL